jgi:hypothetical protein
MKKKIEKKEEKKEVEPVKAAVSDVEDISVFDGQGNFIRSYSLAAHGEDFMKLATGFANKVKGKLR